MKIWFFDSEEAFPTTAMVIDRHMTSWCQLCSRAMVFQVVITNALLVALSSLFQIKFTAVKECLLLMAFSSSFRSTAPT